MKISYIPIPPHLLPLNYRSPPLPPGRQYLLCCSAHCSLTVYSINTYLLQKKYPNKSHILLELTLESPYEIRLTLVYKHPHPHTHAEMKSKIQENYLGRYKCLNLLTIALWNSSAVYFISSKDKSQFHPQWCQCTEAQYEFTIRLESVSDQSNLPSWDHKNYRLRSEMSHPGTPSTLFYTWGFS